MLRIPKHVLVFEILVNENVVNLQKNYEVPWVQHLTSGCS